MMATAYSELVTSLRKSRKFQSRNNWQDRHFQMKFLLRHSLMDQQKVTACSRVDSSNVQITNMKIQVLRYMCVLGYLLFQRNIVLSSSTGSSRPRRAAVWQDTVTYEGCPGSIQPFWISWEPDMWPWCNLADSQRKPHCASTGSHSPVGPASRQRDAADCARVPCDRRILQISSLSTAILALGKARSCREPNLGCRGAGRPGWWDALPKKPAWEL